MIKLLKKLSPARLIALGFISVILLGSALLMLPWSTNEGFEINYIDALYTSTSAVCVTGLVVVDVGTAFTPFGQFIIAALIQIGGLGVATIGALIILAMGKKINMRGRNLIREASNLGSGKGIVRFIRSVFLTTITIELIGAILSFIVFVKDYPPHEALGISIFHSIAAFNNAGFDNLGLSGDVYSNVSLIPYQDNLLLNFSTCGLIFFGGIGFLVIRDVIDKRGNWKKLSMHSKVVLTMSIGLIVIGTLLIKLTEDVSWLGAFFYSISVRTAGFSTYNLGTFSNAGLLVLTVLMFIGASP
ncbi:MAG: potassium transporter TrkG, partial [Oscillospiraceae bacterium]|nr:potassium transporter TrkG [Oscillospiraceae bacterium]